MLDKTKKVIIIFAVTLQLIFNTGQSYGRVPIAFFAVTFNLYWKEGL